MTTTPSLPTWDMTTMFPAIDSPERASSYADLVALIERQAAAMPAVEAITESSGPEVVKAFDEQTTLGSEILELALRHMTYLHGFTSVDTRNRLAQAKTSELMILLAQARTLQTRLTAWIGTLNIDTLLAASETARAFEYQVREASIEARHLMSPAEESLQAQLDLSGGSAWSQMYDEVTSQITVPFEEDGETTERPISAIRNLATTPDRVVRKRAFRAELAAWERWETPIAAALNSIKGQHTTVATRRGWDEVLDSALFQNHIDRATLDAMLEAARESFPDFRRYFQAKARLLGVEKLAFYDLFAPVASADTSWTWDDAWAFVAEQFGSYSAKLRDLVTTSVEERWIDVGPRPGKVDGAFCMPIGGGKSRVMLNFSGTYDSVNTLAHELGHAYHNLCQADVPALRRGSTPMTLAETASTFCETILRNAAIAQGTPDEQLAILEGALQDAAQVTVDISSRFLFEQAVFERRRERALSPEEFCDLMRDAQRQTYGDGLDEETLHPYMWAAKGHYYSGSAAYYNYPYMFGLLFGLGLYSRYEADPDAFRASYDDLLATTGDADAATLGARFGIDTTSKEFWTSSLDIIRRHIDTFETLVEQRLANSK